MGMESERGVELMTPLSARTYLEAYNDLEQPDDQVGLKPLLERFEGRDLVTAAALELTWPNGDWKFIEEEEMTPSHSFEPDELENAPDQNLKSLRDRSMDILLQSLVDQSEDNPELMAEAELMTDFIPMLRAKLYALAGSLKPSSPLLHLLCKALENEVEIDLSPFTTLTSDDLSFIVAELRKYNMAVLNLSDMPNLKPTDLRKVLGVGFIESPNEHVGAQASSSTMAANTTGSLRALILLENPQIPLEFLTQYLGEYEVYHSELFRQAIWTEGPRLNASSIPILEFAAPNIVSQLVWVGIPNKHNFDPKFRLENGKFNWNTLEFSAESPRSMGSAKPLGFKHYPLDVPLPPNKMAECLMQLLRFLTSPKMTWYKSWTTAAARCFAKVFTGANGGGYGVGPLSFVLSHVADCWGGDEEWLRTGPLKHNQWAIILIHEAFDAKDQEQVDKGRREAESQEPSLADDLKKHPEIRPVKRLRYALAKALPASESSQKPFLIADIPDYLEHVLGEHGKKLTVEAKELSKWWKNTLSAVGGEVSYYEDDDIYEILERVYSTDKAAVKRKPVTTTDVVDDLMAWIFSMQASE